MINIKSVADLSDLERMSLMDLSYSRIDTYKMCPAKYFYGYIQKEPRLFGEAAVLGNIVHSVLEDNLSNEKDLDIESLLILMNKRSLSGILILLLTLSLYLLAKRY